jgi:hypothetical protein
MFPRINTVKTSLALSTELDETDIIICDRCAQMMINNKIINIYSKHYGETINTAVLFTIPNPFCDNSKRIQTSYKCFSIDLVAVFILPATLIFA